VSLLQGFFNTGTYAVTRTARGALDSAGNYSPGATSTFSIAASVQPLSGRALKDLPEGARADDYRWVYTDSELRTEQAGVDPDVVEIEGEDYRVEKVEHFLVLSGHYRATVFRLDVP
jgi:hypothetical protein